MGFEEACGAKQLGLEGPRKLRGRSSAAARDCMSHERRRRAVVFFLKTSNAWPPDAPRYARKLDEFELGEFAQRRLLSSTHIKASGLLVQKWDHCMCG